LAEPYYKQHWIDVEPERHAAYEQILAFHQGLEALIAPLELKPGLRVLDVGSGPGHTTVELARRLGPSGRVTGIDVNDEFVARASARARDTGVGAQVELIAAAFPPLPFAAASFDRVLCKNVLEYVDSAAATVAEMARVAAPGGFVLALDSDWEMMAVEVESAAQARSDRMIAAAKSIAINEPRIGRKLFGLFREAGLEDVKVTVFAGADTAGRSKPMLRSSLARYALDSGRADRHEVDAWLDDIDRAIERGRFLFILPQFVVRGTKR
jgi:SAM-dependent methyltransferase